MKYVFILLSFVYCFAQDARQVEQNEVFDNGISILSQRVDLTNARLDSLQAKIPIYFAIEKSAIQSKEMVYDYQIEQAKMTLKTIFYGQLIFDCILLILVVSK